jgi:heme exporter protein D
VAALIVTGLMVTGITAIGILIWSFPIVFSKVVILLAIAAGLFVVLGYIVGAWVDRRKATEDVREERQREKEKAKENKPPSTIGLIWTFIKAKKDKYCPLIQVVDK